MDLTINPKFGAPKCCSYSALCFRSYRPSFSTMMNTTNTLQSCFSNDVTNDVM